VNDHILWLVLRKVREARGFGVREAAKIIRCAPSTLSEWESGRSPVSEATLIRIANAYGMTTKAMLLEGLAGDDT
jgi:transcriptional regulator with XRE-family HTH domain